MGRRGRRTTTLVPPQVAIARHLEEAIRFFRKGALPQAESAFRKVLRTAPDLPEANSNLGTVLVALERPEEAVGPFRRSLEKKQMPQSWKGLGDALAALNQGAESAECYRKALFLDPGYVGAHGGLSTLLMKSGDPEGALAHLAAIVEIQPRNLDERCNLAAALLRVGRGDEAEEILQQVLAEDRNHRPALFHLGLCLRDTGDTPGALDAFRRSTEGGAPFPEGEVALAHTHLLAGRMREGWAGYEARRNHPNFDLAHRRLPGREWDGSPLDGRSILVHSEQGFGDLFQFSRFVSHLSNGAERVLLECRRPALRLLRGLAGVDEIVLQGDLPPHDVHVPLLSLPHLLGVSLETLPGADFPYLAPSEEKEEGLSRFLRGLDQGLQVGLVWAGEPNHPNDRNRSATFADLAPLVHVEGVQAVSLQFGEAAKQRDANPEGPRVLDVAPLLADFHDTASVLAQLDMVVTVDTAVAHLAGAMGIPVSILLPFAPEWRWMEEREDSPWYPSARLFRQKTPGLWHEPVQRIKEHLEQRITRPS